MSDTYRRYAAIRTGPLIQFYQPRPTGHRERHLNTLGALICGLTGGQRAHLSTIADHAVRRSTMLHNSLMFSTVANYCVDATGGLAWA